MIKHCHTPKLTNPQRKKTSVAVRTERTRAQNK